jgi:hypothetical protein
VKATIKKIIYISLVSLVLTGCEIERVEDKKSEEYVHQYTDYLESVIEKDFFEPYFDDVKITLKEKRELEVKIWVSYHYKYDLGITANEHFSSLSPEEKFSLIHSFITSLRSNVDYSLMENEGIDLHGLLYLSEDYKHTINKDEITFISGEDKYTASKRTMTDVDRFNYRNRSATEMYILTVNGTENVVGIY